MLAYAPTVAKIAALYRGRLREFSLEPLMRLATALDRDVRIGHRRTPTRRYDKVVVDAA